MCSADNLRSIAPHCWGFFFARLRSPLRLAVAVGAVRQSVRTVRDFPPHLKMSPVKRPPHNATFFQHRRRAYARCSIFSSSPQFVACEATSEAERCYLFSSSRLWSLMKRHFAMLKFFIISDLSPVKRHAPAERCYIFSASRSSQSSTPRRIGAEIRSFVRITARLRVFTTIASRNHVAEPFQPSPLATLNAHARTHARIYARF